MSWANDESRQEARRLLRIVAAPEFQFVVVHHNAYPVIDEVEKLLREAHPDRPFSRVRLGQLGYKGFVNHYREQKSGFVLVEDWWRTAEDIDMGVGINGARERFSRMPVALIVFMRFHLETARMVMKVMPDLWSIKTTVMELSVDLDAVQKDQFKEGRERANEALLRGNAFVSTYGSLEQNKETLEAALTNLAANPPKQQNLGLRTAYYNSAMIAAAGYAELWDRGLKLGSKALKEYEEYNVADKAKAEIHELMGDILLKQRQLKKAQIHLQKAMELFDPMPIDRAKVGIKYAGTLALEKKYRAAEMYLTQMEGEIRNLGFPDLTILWLYGLASTYVLAGSMEAAIPYLNEMEKISAETKNFKSLIQAYKMRGHAYAKMKKYQAALVAYKDALQYLTLSRSSPEYQANLLDSIGSMEILTERHEDALATYLEMLELIKESPSSSIAISDAYSNIGVIYHLLGDTEKGNEYFELAKSATATERPVGAPQEPPAPESD